MSSTLTINSNIASLNAQRYLGASTAALQQSFERLSSGLRLNQASDDAAGLSIVASLNSASKVYTQGIRNLNDGISAYSIAQGATQQLESVVTRIQELSEESSNGTLGSKQRTALNSEANALVNEYNRIVSTTSFNGLNLIDGSNSTITLQAGYGQNGSITLAIGQQLQRNVGDGTFTAPVSYSGSSYAGSIALSDLNGDGKADMIVSNYANGTVSVFMGNGDGTFTAPVAYSAGGGPWEVITADLNGDGKVDLVTANRTNQTVGILVGNGDGTFQTAVSYQVGVAPSAVSVADLNGDGKMDVVVANELGGSSVGVLLGNGDGTFRTEITYAAGSAPFSITTADLNGDGRPDIISGDWSSGVDSIYFGNGNGTFQARVTLATSGNPLSVIAADLTNDGNQDIISGSQTASNIDIFFGNGDGTFKADTTLATGFSPRSVIAADVNGDGNVDLITADYGANSIEVFMGNGDGTFKAGISSYAGVNPGALAFGDLNGDGRGDVITSDYGPNTLSVLIGNGNTTPFLPVLNLRTQASSLSVLDQMTTALQRVTSELGSMGAAESRLSVATSNLQRIRINYVSAASQIEDVDVASETAILVKNQILQRAGAAILAQANQQPALALRLLRGI